MAFWGVEVKPGKPFTHQLDGSKGRLHISMATLGLGTAITKSTLQCNIGKKSPVYLCSLYPGKTESLQLNLEFEEDGGVIFSVIGPRSIHLCGYYIASGRNGNAFEESESYGEDIGDTETDRSDFSDEDGYDDSFIDDDANLEVSPPSPISNEEEVSRDSRPKGRKGSQRRLRKKYQLVESDDDGCLEEKIIVNDSMHDQSKEIDNEDSRLISSLFKDKSPGRVSDQEMDDKVDRGTVEAENKNGEDGGHLVIEAKLKTDNVVADSQAPREAEPLDHLVGPCTVLEVGDIKKSKKKKKGKEKETKGSCNDHSIKLENGAQDEPKMDQMTQDLLPGNEEHLQHADDEVDAENKNGEDGGHLVIEAKLKTDNVVADSQASREVEPLDHLVDPCTVLDVGDIKKSKKKKKGKEKETKSSCNDHSIKLENGVQDEPKMDKMTQDLLPGNDEHQQHADDEKTETTDKILPSSQADQGQDEKPKKKRKERSKEETYSNADGDNVALPSAEMDSQKRPKKKKKEHNNKASHPEADDGNNEGIIQDYESNRDTTGYDIHKFSEEEQHQKLTNEISEDNGAHDLLDGNQSEDKKVKKKKKKSKGEGNVEVVKSDVSVSVEQGGEMMKEDGNNTVDAKPSHVRTLSNGLVVQELEMGTEGGKIAALGKKISIHYTGKLKENGVVFESNAGQAPFKFRLGKGEVIEGWDIGLEGMRVGEKRRLEIPPSMTSKNGGHSDKIPPDSWLVYDFELVKVH